MFKRVLLVVMIAATAVQIQAQNNAKKAPKPRYSVSGGLLGAFNLSQFRVTDGSYVASVDYKFGFGFAGGAWLNIPISDAISFEPQAQFSVLKYALKSETGVVKQFAGTIQYQSFPMLFKVKAGEKLAVLFGPQLDFNNSLKNDNTQRYFKRNFQSFSTAATFGLELFPNEKVQIYGRYFAGLNDMKDGANPNLVPRFYNEGFQFGIKYKLFGKKIVPPPPVVVAPPPPPPPADTDKDGIIDTEDKCPTVAGLAKYGGCPIPDTDKDGINDEMDKCPTVPGLAKYNGCPIPDTDKDGINDEEDKCPTVPGLGRYQGCPIPDSDGDGVNDEEDKCPTVAGVSSNGGCPDLAADLKVAAKSIYFVSGSDKFAYPKLAPQKLQYALDMLNKYATLKIDIEGHTDNTGSAKVNKALSQKRADAIKKFFLSKGIAAERVTATGFGNEKPVADNKTAKGRQENRRVEILPRWN
ncbi:MAG: OmpA family protein [Chitinophagia bacterium]|nr:OmpA family protein [Chitinophagia bacterium]